MTKRLALALALVANLSAAPGFWRSITVNSGEVSGTHTDFPMKVAITQSYLATVPNGGFAQNANGYDIRFWSDSTLSTSLDHEIERYVSTTGEIVMWVRVPSMAVGSVIYMSYGDPAISTSQENKAGVWNSAFKLVAHLPNGTTLTALDSTTNANNLTNTGTVTATAGQIDGGATGFSTTPKKLEHADHASLKVTTAFTLSAWIKPANYTTYQTIIAKGTANTRNYYLGLIESTGVLFGSFTQGAGTFRSAIGSGAISTSVFTHVAVVYNGSTLQPYVNGVANGSGLSVTGSADDTSAAFQVGVLDTALDAFSGPIDEPRLANVARSANWLLAEYNNQKTSSTFFTVGAQQARSSMTTLIASR